MRLDHVAGISMSYVIDHDAKLDAPRWPLFNLVHYRTLDIDIHTGRPHTGRLLVVARKGERRQGERTLVEAIPQRRGLLLQVPLLLQQMLPVELLNLNRCIIKSHDDFKTLLILQEILDLRFDVIM